MLRLGLALCVLLSVASPVSGSIQKIADRIYYGGEIITADDARPWAQSVAVGDGRIIGVGPLAEVVRLRGAETELIDLDGRTLAPGFIDACGHLSRTGLQAVTANLLAPPEGHSRSIADIVKVLQQWRQVTFAAREFGLILGFGYDESQFDGARRLIRADLDAVSAELPVIAIHRSGGRSVFNSRALELAGMETAIPEDGERNGVLEGGAHRLALRRVLETLAEQNVTPLIDAAQELYARFGHTTAQDGRPGRAVLNAYSKLAAGGQFKIDVIAYPDAARNGGHAPHSAFHSRNYMNGFRIGGMMLRFDGAPQAGAARLTARWPGAMPDGREDGTALLTAALQSGRHIIADPRGPLDVWKFTSALSAAKAGAVRRPVMILDSRDPAFGRLETVLEHGVVPALHMATASPEGGGPAARADMPAVRFLMEQGIRFTACHGTPDARPASMPVVAGLVRQAAEGEAGAPPGTARTPALKAVTLWAAGQYFEEEEKGSITVGKLADLVILSANPMTAGVEALAEITVEETVKEGETVFLRAGAEGEPSLVCAESDPCFSGITAALGSVKAAMEDHPKFVDAKRPARRAGLPSSRDDH